MLIQLLVLSAVVGQSATVEARVKADQLEVFDDARDEGYAVATLARGEAVRVRPDESPRPGWLAIDPPASVFCWVEESALKLAGGGGGGEAEPIAAKVKATAVIRSGNPRAKLPGPPHGSLRPGDRVWLADRPALEVGSRDPKRWRAIAPPAGRACFVPADGVDWARAEPAPEPTEIPTAFTTAGDDPELKRVDAMLLAETTGQPVEKWRLATIRESYGALAKRADAEPDRVRAVEERLRRLEGLERTAAAARAFVEAASRAHALDDDFARIERKLADVERERTRAFDAVGFIQPSSRMLDGRKLFALIGREGTVVAYLDVPPGVDPEPLTARRVGIHGQSRYDPDLKARLISVRDLTNLEPKG